MVRKQTARRKGKRDGPGAVAFKEEVEEEAEEGGGPPSSNGADKKGGEASS